MSKSLVFFDKEGNYINTKWNDSLERHEADLIFHENSNDTFKSIGLYLFENIPAFDFEAQDELFLSKFQLFNEYGFKFSGNTYTNEYVLNIESTNTDPNFFSKWIYGINFDTKFPIGSTILFNQPFSEFTNINIPHTVISTKKGAIMILSNINNLDYFNNYTNLDYANITIKGLNSIGVMNYYTQTLENKISAWSEPDFYDMLYLGRKLNIVNTELNNKVVTINSVDTLDKSYYIFSASALDVIGDLKITLTLKTDLPAIYSGNLSTTNNIITFDDGAPDTLLPGREFKIDSTLNANFLTVAEISTFKSNVGLTDYTVGSQVIYNNKIYQCFNAYTQTSDSTITPLDINYWSENITYIKVNELLSDEYIDTNVYLTSNIFTYTQPFNTDGRITSNTFSDKWKEEFNIFNIDLSYENTILTFKLLFAEKWADIKIESINTDITKQKIVLEKIIEVKESLINELDNNISDQFNYDIVFTDIDEWGIKININGMVYEEDFADIYNGITLDLERSIDKTLRNWLSKNYGRLYSLGIICNLKTIGDNNPIYYNTVSIRTYYPNVPLDFDVEVGTTARYYIDHSLIVFNDMGNYLSIDILGRNLAITSTIIGNTVSIPDTLENWTETHSELLFDFGIIVENVNNTLFFKTQSQNTLLHDYVVNTTKINLPGSDLFKIIKRSGGNVGSILTSNSIILSEQSNDSFEDVGFSTGMITGVNNTPYPYNNQNYNILYLDPHIMNLSYQGPFWGTLDKNCTKSPFVTIAFNSGFGATACDGAPLILSGEFTTEFDSQEFNFEYIPGNTYSISVYNVASIEGSLNMVDLIYLQVTNQIYVLGDGIVILDSMTNDIIGQISLLGNSGSISLLFNNVNNYVYVLTNDKIFVIDPILNYVLYDKTINLSFNPNYMTLNPHTGDIYVTYDNGYEIYNNTNLQVDYHHGYTYSLYQMTYNTFERDMYITTNDNGVIRVNGDDRTIQTTYNIPGTIDSQLIYDPFNTCVYVFGSTLFKIDSGLLTNLSISSGTENYLLHNNLNGELISNIDDTITIYSDTNIQRTVAPGHISMSQYDGYIYISSNDNSNIVNIINSTSGELESTEFLSTPMKKMIFNPDRNSMIGFQPIDRRITEISVTLNVEITINNEISNEIIDNQFGTLSQYYVPKNYLWLNTLDHIRRPRNNFNGDIRTKYKWRWENDQTPEIFMFDFTGNQLPNSGAYAYTGNKPLELIALSRTPNKDITKINLPEYQQTIFEEIIEEIDYIDSETNISIVPEPIELFIGFKSDLEGVKSSTLKLYKTEDIKLSIPNSDSIFNLLYINTINSPTLGTYGVIKLDTNSVNNFLTDTNGNPTGLKIGQYISLILTDVNNKTKHISHNNSLILRIKELYNKFMVVDFTNGSAINEFNVIDDYPKIGKKTYLKTEIVVQDCEIATFNISGQTEIEDIRYAYELTNVGQNIAIDDTYIFKEYDINEQGIDWTYLNKKRKELLINRHDIFPYIGSYKAIINAINYFGYNDLELYEYYRNVNPLSVDFSKLKKVEIPDIFDNSVKGWNEKDFIKNTMPNPNYEDTNLFNLTYHITDKDGNNVLTYSLREVLIKLQGLKNWLQKNVIPITHKILDITGRIDFVGTNSITHKQYDAKGFRINQSMNPVNLSLSEAYLMPVNSGSTVYNVVIDFDVIDDIVEYFTIDVSTYKTEKEWSPFFTYGLGDRISYYGFIYESNLTKNRVKDPRKYENVSQWIINGEYEANDLVKYNGRVFQWINTISSSQVNPAFPYPHEDIINWTDVTEWIELKYEPVQTIKEFRTTLEPMRIVVDSNIDPFISIKVITENGYGQTYKLTKNYELRGSKDLVDTIMVIEADPLPIRIDPPTPFEAATTTTSTTTTSTTTTSTTTTTTSTTTTTTSTTTTTTIPPLDCSFDNIGATVTYIESCELPSGAFTIEMSPYQSPTPPDNLFRFTVSQPDDEDLGYVPRELIGPKSQAAILTANTPNLLGKYLEGTMEMYQYYRTNGMADYIDAYGVFIDDTLTTKGVMLFSSVSGLNHYTISSPSSITYFRNYPHSIIDALDDNPSRFFQLSGQLTGAYHWLINRPDLTDPGF